ncbi:tandem-95 repeat protein [Moritella sp. 5]|uniref:tandem-95 repeat protein n=1 Tax=Moritella sp. 5 TaxID=2746231 RepID=UPI001BADDE09|nr:Ig-like domain-containing protein [Moritella sp. 5]QUM80198.1 tandem-95 repeat protein [Moritella sp. 5]
MNKLIHLIPVILTGYLTACGGGGDSATPPTYISGSIADRDVKLNEDTVYEGSLSTSDTLGWNWKITSNALFGTATLTKEGDLRYTPNENYHGPDGIVVKVTNGNTYDIALINFDVKSINDLPVLNSKTFFGISGKKISGKISATDVDSYYLSYKVKPTFNMPDYISFELSSFGSFTFKSEKKTPHSIEIPIIISDGEGDVETTLTFNIKPTSVSIADRDVKLNEDTTYEGSLSTSDTLGWNWKITSNALFGTATLTKEGDLRYTPNENYHGPDGIVVKVTNGDTVGTVRINFDVKSINDLPVVNNKTFFGIPGKYIGGKISATDVDSYYLSYKVKPTFNMPDYISFELSSFGSFTFKSEKKTPHSIEIPIIISDGEGDVETTLTFNIEAIKKKEYISEQSFSLNEDEPAKFTIKTTNTTAPNFTLSIAPSKGIATLDAKGILTYTPNRDVSGPDSLEITVTENGYSDKAKISLSISSVNDTPKVLGKRTFRTSTNKIEDRIKATDVDGDTLNFKLKDSFTLPEDLTFKLDRDGSFNITTKSMEESEVELPIMISDGTTSIEANFTFNFNIEPMISEQSFALNEDEPAKFTIKTTNTTAPNFTLSTAPSKGKATLDAKGILTYTPNRDVSGPDSLEITVTENGYSDKAKISLSISSVNDAPKVLGKRTFTSPTKMIKGRIKATDVDGDTLNFKLKDSFTLPKDLTFNLDSDGSFNITTKSKEESEVELPIIISDGTKSIEANFTFNLNSKLTDPLYSQQWHLKNTGQKAFSRSRATVGHDINIGNLHNQGVKGSGVKVAVVDSGLEIKHEDLVENILSGRSYNYVKLTNDPTSTRKDGDHGTSVAGIIAARGFNNIGGRGVAPEASLIGLNYVSRGAQASANWVDSHGGKRTQDVLVINQSYGNAYMMQPYDFMTIRNTMHETKLKEVTSKNNDGRGVLFVKAAGNSFQRVLEFQNEWWRTYQYSAYSKNSSLPRLTAHNASINLSNASFYNTVVSALNANASDPLSSYSSTGAAVFVSAPGGEYGRYAPAIITTDSMGCTIGYARTSSRYKGFNRGEEALNEDCNYTSSFNGTSSAAPVVSGVAALIFSVDDAITWRDVRYIIAKTAKKIDDKFKPILVDSYIAEPGWITNNAGFNFHNWYGFGLIDASEAVKMAQTYIKDKRLLPPLKETVFIPSDDVTDLGIGEGTPTEKSVNITKDNDLTIEAVQVKLNIKHGRNSDLSIELISPQGTSSMLLTPRSLLTKDADFKNTVLLSNAFYGEKSAGTWTIKVTDTNNSRFIYYSGRRLKELKNNIDDGLLKNVSIRIYGHEGI